MSAPELGLYVSSNGVDHGPLSLKEATERVRSGEFKPADLAWHQGVSGWMPLKDLPEWNAMQAAPALPLAKKPTTDETPEGSTPPMGSSPKKVKLREGSQVQTKSSTPMDGFADGGPEEQQPQSGGLVSKLLIVFAFLIFLAALGIMGLYCYNNWDEILLELQ